MTLTSPSNLGNITLTTYTNSVTNLLNKKGNIVTFILKNYIINE